MDIITLKQSFYDKYKGCKEILQKSNRPYLMVLIEINDIYFAIPFRSNVSHKYVFWTDKENRCGLDFTKTVVIDPTKDIKSHNHIIRQNEYDFLKKRTYIVYKKFNSFFNTYKKAYKNTHIAHNANLIKKSALKYFIDKII